MIFFSLNDMSNYCTCFPLDLSFFKWTEQPWWISPAKPSAIPNSIFVVTPPKTDQPRKVNPNENSIIHLSEYYLYVPN